ncbi:MAG: phosphopantetheine-binding protein [Polyangiaceae bacterium]
MSEETREQALARIAQREDILGRVRQILIDALHVQRPPEQIDPDVSLFGTGLCLDSVDAVELLVCLETEFGLVADPASGRAIMRTVNTVIDAVVAHAEVPS